MGTDYTLNVTTKRRYISNIIDAEYKKECKEFVSKMVEHIKKNNIQGTIKRETNELLSSLNRETDNNESTYGHYEGHVEWSRCAIIGQYLERHHSHLEPCYGFSYEERTYDKLNREQLEKLIKFCESIIAGKKPADFYDIDEYDLKNSKLYYIVPRLKNILKDIDPEYEIEVEYSFI